MALYLDPITHPSAWNVVVFAGTLKTPVKTGKGTAGATETLKGQPPAKGTITFWAWTPAHFAAWNPILDVLRFNPAKGGTTNPSGTASATKAGGVDGSTFAGASQSREDASPADPGDHAATAGTIPTPDNTSGKADGAKKSDDKSAKDPPALSAASAIDIWHPSLADIGVAHVLPPEKLGNWEPDGDDGLYKREIEFLEFTQPPATSIAATPTGSTDKANPGDSVQAGAQENPAAQNASASTATTAKGAQGAHGAAA